MSIRSVQKCQWHMRIMIFAREAAERGAYVAAISTATFIQAPNAEIATTMCRVGRHARGRRRGGCCLTQALRTGPEPRSRDAGGPISTHAASSTRAARHTQLARLALAGHQRRGVERTHAVGQSPGNPRFQAFRRATLRDRTPCGGGWRGGSCFCAM